MPGSPYRSYPPSTGLEPCTALEESDRGGDRVFDTQAEVVRTRRATRPFLFRKVNKAERVEARRLSVDAVRQLLLRRAAQAGGRGTLAESVSPHGLRAGFVTTAYRNGVSDEEIMGHTRHRSVTTMRSYVRRPSSAGAARLESSGSDDEAATGRRGRIYVVPKLGGEGPGDRLSDRRALQPCAARSFALY